MDLSMQLLVIVTSLALGYVVGRSVGQEEKRRHATRMLFPPVVRRDTRDAAAGTEDTMLIETQELTMEALRTRLRAHGSGASGNKEDLIRRYDEVRRGRVLTLAT